MCERVQVELIAFGLSLVIGSLFALWPGKAQRFDERMARVFKSTQTHIAFIRGFGIILLCLACASLLAALFDLMGQKC